MDLVWFFMCPELVPGLPGDTEKHAAPLYLGSHIIIISFLLETKKLTDPGGLDCPRRRVGARSKAYPDAYAD